MIAYDSRAHGESEGNACTYGFYEKEDLRRVLDRVDTKPIVVMGFSLGAAVALQAAAVDRRIAAVMAVSPFSDLRTVGSERAPFFASKGNISDAFKLAEDEGKFRADDVSPMAAAADITAPTLTIHGERDDETPPAHSRRIFAALRGPKRLIVVPNADHDRVLEPASGARSTAGSTRRWRRARRRIAACNSTSGCATACAAARSPAASGFAGAVDRIRKLRQNQRVPNQDGARRAQVIDFSDDRKPTKDQVIDLYRSVGWSSADKPDALHNGLLASHSLVTAWTRTRWSVSVTPSPTVIWSSISAHDCPSRLSRPWDRDRADDAE